MTLSTELLRCNLGLIRLLFTLLQVISVVSSKAVLRAIAIDDHVVVSSGSSSTSPLFVAVVVVVDGDVELLSYLLPMASLIV